VARHTSESQRSSAQAGEQKVQVSDERARRGRWRTHRHRYAVRRICGLAHERQNPLEFGATSLGNSKRSGIADASLDLDSAIYQLGLTASIPVEDRFELLGGLGAFRLYEDGEASTIAGPVRIDASESGAYPEVGARYSLNQPWSLRAGYTWYYFDAGGDGNL